MGELTLEESKESEYTKEEWDCLTRLPNKEYLITSK